MESSQITETKKRTLTQMLASDLASRLRSKQDYMVYLDQQ